MMLMMLTWWPAMTLRLAECVSFLGVGGRNSGSARDLPSGHQHQHQPAPTTLLLSNARAANARNKTLLNTNLIGKLLCTTPKVTKHITSSHQTCSNNPQHFCPTRCSDNTTLAKCIVVHTTDFRLGNNALYMHCHCVCAGTKTSA